MCMLDETDALQKWWKEDITVFCFLNFLQIMWFSSGGTKSVIHNDDVDTINCVFSGSKEFIFMNITKYRNQVNNI